MKYLNNLVMSSQVTQKNISMIVAMMVALKAIFIFCLGSML